MSRRILKRLARTAAFAVGAGIAFMGAGSIFQFGALESALFGATGSILGLVMGVAFTFAGKAEVSEKDFDSLMNDAIQSVSSKADKNK